MRGDKVECRRWEVSIPPNSVEFSGFRRSAPFDLKSVHVGIRGKIIFSNPPSTSPTSKITQNDVFPGPSYYP